MEFQRIRCFDSFYLKTKELGWKENHEIQNTSTENSKGNIIGEKNQVLKIWGNYITELYDQPNWPENLEAEYEEEGDTDEEGPHILRSEVEKELSGRWGIRRLQEMKMYLGMYSKRWEKMTSE